MTKRRRHPDDFAREAATVALEASDDTLAREIQGRAYERARHRTLYTAAQRRKGRQAVKTAACMAVGAALFAGLAQCALHMNGTHGFL